MPRYTVVQPVEHDHVRVESGEIELTADAAAPLVAIGALVGANPAGDASPAADDAPVDDAPAEAA